MPVDEMKRKHLCCVACHSTQVAEADFRTRVNYTLFILQSGLCQACQDKEAARGR